MKKLGPSISDHALLRYLERVRGVDVEALRQEVARRVCVAHQDGASGVIVDGFCYKIEGGVVTTVIRTHRRDVRHGPKRRGRVIE